MTPRGKKIVAEDWVPILNKIGGDLQGVHWLIVEGRIQWKNKNFRWQKWQ